MTEEVSSQLTQLSRLQVKARSLVLAQWRRTPDPFDAARRLNVAWYVHGTVRHVAPQLLVSVELVRPATGEQVWAKRFARSDADVFAAQAEVAESVAVVVGGRLSPRERAALVRRPSRNNEAYRLYVYGNVLLARRTQPEVRRAVEAYTEAVRLDPSFAAAWARLSLARGIQLSWGWSESVPSDSLRAIVRAAARHAVSLDTLSSDAWLALFVAADEDYGTRQAYIERSLRLDSLNAEAFYWAGVVYALIGVYEAAVPLYRQALALDPGSANTWRKLANVTLYAERLAEAEALLDTTLALGPWWAALSERAYVRFLRGNAVGALADFAEAERLDRARWPPEARALYTVLMGDSTPAGAVLARLRAQADSGQQVFAWLARFEIALGHRAEALASLQRLRSWVNPSEPRCAPTATCSASIRTWELLHDPIFALLRGDPRFQRLWAETRPRVPWLEGYH
jgi:tetratricopeptide (TPR) repeat protein